MIVAAIDGAQAPGQIVGRDQAASLSSTSRGLLDAIGAIEWLTGGMRLRDLDLRENELEIRLDVRNHATLPKALCAEIETRPIQRRIAPFNSQLLVNNAKWIGLMV